MNTCCEKCGTKLNFYYHRLVIFNNPEWVGIEFSGWCPDCGRKVKWTEQYKFIETSNIIDIE